MGVMKLFSSCGSDECIPTLEESRSPASRAPQNPDPRNFVIRKVEQHGSFLIAEILYPDCTNFEGKKILVFKKISERQLRSLKVLDPHFCDGGHLSPIARFVPTTAGWRYARRFCKTN